MNYEKYLINDQVLKQPMIENGGDKRIRTDDPLLAKQMLYQLSYIPVVERAKGFEPSTSTLARLRSTPELRPLDLINQTLRTI